MNVNRTALSQHLARIMCNGQVEGAVFSGAFETVALSPDQLLLVQAPALEGAESLEGPVGVPLLDTWSAALRVISAVDEKDVTIRMEEHRLVVDEGERGVLRLITAAPRTIATYVDPGVLGKVLERAPDDAPGLTLTKTLMGNMQGTFQLFKASEVEVFFGPGGGKVRVGHENSNVAEFADEALQAEEPYSLLFGRHLVDVIRVVADSAEPVILRSGGPGAMVLIQAGDYRYLLGPRSRGAGAQGGGA